MNVVLDTCAVLALAYGDLPESASAALRQAPEAYVSAVSPWEIAIKVATGRLRLNSSPVEWFADLAERHHLREVAVDSRIGCAAASLPPVHRDPFDRAIVALAQARGLTVLTSDRNIARYPGVTTRW